MTRSYRLGTAPLYGKLRDGCEGLPPRIVTDKLGHYRRAFNKYFYHTGVKLVHGVPIACRKHRLKHNNNPIERENQRIKTRTKTMRGFKSHNPCRRFLDMLDIMHNFIKPNMALRGGYPSRRGRHQTSPGKKQDSIPHPNLSHGVLRCREKGETDSPKSHQPNSHENRFEKILIVLLHHC